MSSPESSQTSNGSNLGISGVCQVLPAVGDAGAVVEEDGDVDAHDSNDAATVEIHHEEVLEKERLDLVVHHLDQTEGEHEQDEYLAVHRRERHPQLGEGLPPVPEDPSERVQIQRGFLSWCGALGSGRTGLRGLRGLRDDRFLTEITLCSLHCDLQCRFGLLRLLLTFA